MKKSILTICLLVATVVCSNVTAQTITGVSQAQGLNLPKRDCEVAVRKQDFSITGNNKKDYTLVRSDVSISSYKIIVKKTDGKAKTSFNIIIDGVINPAYDWTFENGKVGGERTIELNNMAGRLVVLRVKNHSATNKIEGNFQVFTDSKNMLFNTNNVFDVLDDDETIIERITQSYERYLRIPCNGKGTIEITRLGGVSSAEIVVFQGGNSYGNGATVLKTVTMSANETTKRINLNNINPNSGTLRFEIRNIQTNKFIRAKIGAWFN
uniref:hypothetical protein n=1 Tax=Gelidibacter sp. TaxID=2018083 RepID=UPI00404A3211